MPVDLPLACHPDARGGPVRRVTARLRRLPDGALAVAYAIEGDLSRLRLPAPRQPRTGERLWEHTCCELFVAGEGMSAYREFNFSPSGEWAAYAFSGYREGMRAHAVADPRIALRCGNERLELSASIRAEGGVRLGIAAVLEDESGALSWWALRHPPGRPDFHHPTSFACALDEVRD